MPSEPPPTADLVASVVRAALGAAAAGLDIRPVREGGEHASWSIGSMHVARFALGQSGFVRQRREVALRDWIRARVHVAVPISVAMGEWRPRRSFTIDARLPGASGEEQSVSVAGEDDLARLLAALRSIPAGDAEAIGVPRVKSRPMRLLARRAAEAARWLIAHGERTAAPLACIEARSPAIVESDAPRVLVHRDLKGEHLRVTDEGRISGVLDWTDAALGDPAVDVAGLAIAIGARAAARVAAAGGYDDTVCARGLAAARYETVVRLAFRLRNLDDSPLPLLRAQLARAWENAVSS